MTVATHGFLVLPPLVDSVWDFLLLVVVFKATKAVEELISPSNIHYPHPALYTVAWNVLWAVYGFSAGLVATGLWVIGEFWLLGILIRRLDLLDTSLTTADTLIFLIAHECGHQAYSESRFINNTVGWILHSACVA